MAIVALIPARGGSKRIPNKNIASCYRKPLLYWTASAAKGSRYIDRVLLSTDSEEIADEGHRLGLEVPFLRPTSLAQSETPMVPVMQHALEWLLSNGCVVDAFVLLQPTQPLRESHHIDSAFEIFQKEEVETVVSVTELPHIYHPEIVHKINAGRLMSFLPGDIRSESPKADKLYARNGPAILINDPKVVQRGEKFGDPVAPYIMSSESSIDIDEYIDLFLAECLLRRRYEKGTG